MPTVGWDVRGDNSGSRLKICKYFAGVDPHHETESNAESEVSTALLNAKFTFHKQQAQSTTFRSRLGFGPSEQRKGEFQLVAEGSLQPLELRSLRGAKAMSMGWMPECCVYETTEPNGRIVKNIEVEAPGVLFEDVEVISTKDGARISARKNVPYHDSFQTTVDEDDRCYGLSVRDFMFKEKNSIFQPVPAPEGLSMFNGVLHVRLWKVEMNKTVKKRSPNSISPTAGSIRGERTVEEAEWQ